MHLFLACASGNITQMRDARSGRLLRSINTAGLGDCTSRRLGDDLTGRVFIPGGLALGILDGRTGALVSTLPFQTWCNASFELDGHAGSVVELDQRNGDVLAAPSVVPGTGPPATTVLVLDGHSGAIVRRLRVPENPLALLVNPLTGHLLVASAGPTDVLGDPLGNGTLSVLDMASGDTIRQVEVGLVPGSLFADRRAGRLVVVNYTSNLLSGEPLTRRYPDGWWPHALRWLKHAFGWLPYTAPVVPPPPTNATVTTLDLTKL